MFEHGRKLRIGIVSFSAIPDDPRVRRQGELFGSAGWDVVAIGLPGHRSNLPAWRCIAVDENSINASPDSEAFRLRASPLLSAVRQAVNGPASSQFAVWVNVIKKAMWLIAKDPLATAWIARLAAVRFFQGRTWVRIARALRTAGRAMTLDCAENFYWKMNDRFQQLYQAGRGETVNLWLANDWTTLPIVRTLAREQRVPFAYDTHELAVDEYAHRWMWRLTQRPMIAAIEGIAANEASFVSCVSDGIARRLTEIYSLGERPLVVRNTPCFESVPFRATKDDIRVLYHGLVSPGRGLEACILSVALWRPEFSLTIRGSGSSDYLAHLVRIAMEPGISGRVTFAPAVPMVDLVRTAAAHDVGLFALPDHSLQNVYALPNKFFEYIMAGLALCVSDLPEMASIVNSRQLGVLIEAVTPEAVAAAVNRLNRTTIDLYKRNALSAAQEFNWEREGSALLRACERAAKYEKISGRN